MHAHKIFLGYLTPEKGEQYEHNFQKTIPCVEIGPLVRAQHEPKNKSKKLY